MAYLEQQLTGTHIERCRGQSFAATLLESWHFDNDPDYNNEAATCSVGFIQRAQGPTHAPVYLCFSSPDDMRVLAAVLQGQAEVLEARRRNVLVDRALAAHDAEAL